MFKCLFKSSVFVAALMGAGLLASPPVLAAEQCQAMVTEPLQKVGETRLRVYFFRVYDATLFTESGGYPDTDAVALQLNYLRDIRAEQLVDTTRDEWKNLGYSIDEQAESWLQQLQSMWPDVSNGDCLIAATDSQQQVRFYNHQGALGSIDDSQFAEQFFAIWLSENSSFKRNRDELVGAR
ncbi:MAG: chalcone isomerase family protein [Idiomarina sp.]|nr:chalcone isomerase family protein [Idiomarina sp.]